MRNLSSGPDRNVTFLTGSVAAAGYRGVSSPESRVR